MYERSIKPDRKLHAQGCFRMVKRWRQFSERFRAIVQLFYPPFLLSSLLSPLLSSFTLSLSSTTLARCLWFLHLPLHVSYKLVQSSSFAVLVILAAALLTLLTMSSAVSCTPPPSSASLALALSTAAMSLPCALSMAPFSGP